MITYFWSVELFNQPELVLNLQFDGLRWGKKYLRLEFVYMNGFISCGISLNTKVDSDIDTFLLIQFTEPMTLKWPSSLQALLR